MLHLLQLNEPLIQMDEGWPVHIFSRKCSLNELLLSLEIYHIPQVCCSCLVTSAMSDSVQPHGLQPVRLPCPWDSLGKSSGVGFQALFQGIFLTHGLNLGFCIAGKFFTTEPPGMPIPQVYWGRKNG